jgi:hypothetical protein
MMLIDLRFVVDGAQLRHYRLHAELFTDFADPSLFERLPGPAASIGYRGSGRLPGQRRME